MLILEIAAGIILGWVAVTICKYLLLEWERERAIASYNSQATINREENRRRELNRLIAYEVKSQLEAQKRKERELDY
jgi:hypothetical protein